MGLVCTNDTELLLPEISGYHLLIFLTNEYLTVQRENLQLQNLANFGAFTNRGG